MKKKTKLTAILLVLCMAIELLPSNMALVSTMVTAFAADDHKHCICGADHDSIGDHTKGEISFSAWSSTNSLPDKTGNYYLMDDVTIPGAWYPVDGTVLCLNGHTITAHNASAIIVSDYRNKDVKFTLTDCKENNIGKITHSESGIGSGVYVYGKGNFIMYGGIITGNFTNNDGGGVFNQGTFTMNGGSITGNNSSHYGSGVKNQGTFTMNGGSITKNQAGVLGGGVANSATFTMNGGIITGNNADYGGGVYNFSNFIMNGGSITSNTANECGGGVRNQATFTMKGGNITENNAEYGGGVDISTTGNFTMNGGSINENTANENGGGVRNTGTFTMNAGHINGNTAEESGGGVSNSGNFTMNVDAYIHDNTASTGGGVSNEGSFTMNSSYIGENKATKDGGGVFNSGTLIMNNGKIGYNEAKGDSGGGVSNKGTFKVNGYVIIAENYGKNSGNVYLLNKSVIYVNGALTGNIGVTSNISSYPVIVAEGSDGYTISNDDLKKLRSDNPDYNTELIVVEGKNKIVLKKIPGAGDFYVFPLYDPTYSGIPKEVTVIPKNSIPYGTITVKYYDAEGKKLDNAPVDAGTYTVKLDVAENENCEAATDLTNNSWKFSIEPKELTVLTADVTINKGQAIPQLTVNVTGFVDGESENTLSGFEKPTASVSGDVDTLDTSITSFNVSYTGGNPTKNYTFSKNTTAKITINEVNIEENDYSTSKDVNAWQKEDIILSPANGYRWISVDGVNWEDSLTLSTEGECSQTFYLKKDDGTVTESKTIEYKLDKTAPSDVKIQYNRNGFKSFLNTITFGLFFKENVEVTAQATDALSGIAGYQYYASDSEVQDVSTITGWKDSLTLTPNSKKIVYIKVTDNVGNITITNNEGVVVYSDSMVSPSASTFDKNIEKQADIIVDMILNDNTLREIKNGDATLISGTDYTINGNTVTISKDYLKNFEKGSTQTLTFVFNPMGVAGDTTSTAALEISIDDSTHYHNAVHNERVEATCTESGSIEHWSCTGCNKLFSDTECTNEITDVVIPAINHKNVVHHERVEATCTGNGNIEYWSCPDCGRLFSEAECTNEITNVVIPAINHKNAVHHERVEVTCTGNGNIEYWSCSDCGRLFSDAECTNEITDIVIPAINHKNVVHHERVEATCTENGNIEYWSCPDCGKLFSDAECTNEITDIVIPAINHKNAVHHERVEATCTENGNNAYWYCPDCSKHFADSEGTINGTIAYNDTDSFVITALGHSFKNYVSDGNATYFEDGTETAHCDHHGCTETDTRSAVGSKLVDLDKPTADIKIKGSSIKQIANILTFGLFFKETQTVTVNASDVGSGVAQTAYYLANTEISDFSDVTWTEFSDAFSINPDNRYVIYVKVTDKVGNFSIVNSDGVVLDSIVSQISAIDGKTYCGAVEVAVSDDNLDSVTLDGNEVTLSDGKLTVSPSDKAQTITAIDRAGNQSAVTIMVNDGHTWDEGDVTTPATAATEGVKTYTCIYCGETRTESIDKLLPEIIEGKNGRWNKASGGWLTFRSNAALADFVSVMVDDRIVDPEYYDLREGSTIVTLKQEYLSTLPAGKHTLSINSTTGTATTEFTIEKAVESAKTGDKTNMGLWISLMFASCCVLTVFRVDKKRKQVR